MKAKLAATAEGLSDGAFETGREKMVMVRF